jgi:hypothetical protein
MAAQPALVVVGIEALDHGEVGFGRAHHRADVDHPRRLQQPHAAAPSACGFQQPHGREFLDNLGQMTARDTIAVRHFADGDRLLAPFTRRAVHQYPQGEVSPLGEPHVNCLISSK